MGIASEIRANLPTCGRCINCKLVIWDDKAELKTAQNLIKFKGWTKIFTIWCAVLGLKALYTNRSILRPVKVSSYKRGLSDGD